MSPIGDNALNVQAMSPENRIEFAETSQKFLCEEYYMHNFTAFLNANSVNVDSPERFESADPTITKKLFFLELTKESQPLKQEQGDMLIRTFLAADDETK